MSYTVYPNAIDGSAQLPIATDNVTPVKAEIVNRQRDAILAIETELGVDPSGTYTTVRARLDAMQATIDTLIAGGGAGTISAILLNGAIVRTAVTNLNFVGANFAVTSAPETGRVNISVTGGSGSGFFTVQDEGSTLSTTINTLNFIGPGVVASLGGPNTADITVSGGTLAQKQETLPVTSNGQTAFTLTQIPADSTAVEMYVNGVKQQYGVDYAVISTAVTYSGIALIIGDKVEFWYIISGIAPASTVINEISFEISGVYSGASVPGFFDPPYLVTSNRTINSVTLIRRTAGVSGTSRCDVLINGVSIFASSATQPQVTFAAGNNAYQTVTAFTTAAVLTNQYIDVSLEDAEVGAVEGLRVIVRFA